MELGFGKRWSVEKMIVLSLLVSIVATQANKISHEHDWLTSETPSHLSSRGNIQE